MTPSHRRRWLAARRAPRPTGPGAPSIIAVLLAVGLAAGIAAASFGSIAVVSAVSVLETDLPDPAELESLGFEQPSVVLDAAGTTELGRFQRADRRVVEFDEIPRVVLDATTTAEDRTFWENDGYDATAILAAVAENLTGASDRGASTITQQLVRARLLPPDATAPGANRYLRKAKELIQAARVTEAFPGEAGKRRIITAYLNEIFYGHDAYGIAAAARRYFGVTELADLTPAQAALLAGLPQAPSELDPYRFAESTEDGRLVVPADAPPVVRRNWILRNLSASRWTELEAGTLSAALREPVVLAGDRPLVYRAPHAVWRIRGELEAILGSAEAVETGGYQVISTIDLELQAAAERWVSAAVVAPNLDPEASAALLDQLEIGKADRAWIERLRGADVHNGALVALDYRTGRVLAYVGSAGYYRDDLASPEFAPKFDVAGDGPRQPGSAWKPIVYGAAFHRGVLTPGSLLLDITTEFGPGWIPHDADNRERGPVLVRDALQNSLNTPAIRALHRVGPEAVAETAAALGIRFAPGQGGLIPAGLAGAIGTVEVTPLQLTAAYGAIANGGRHLPPNLIAEIRDRTGAVVYRAPDPAAAATEALSPASAFLVADILAGNTDPRQNPGWAEVLAVRNGPDGERRPAAAKTGTTNDARDLSTYGFLAPPEDPASPALAVGVWLGNSDHSRPESKRPATSLHGPAPLWQAFVREATAGWPVAGFRPPEGVVEATIDAWSGGRPGAWTRATRTEWFIAGTQPGAESAVDRDGLLYVRACGSWRVDPVQAELGPESWRKDVADWTRRARSGPGRTGAHDTATAYLPGERSWGGPIAGPCPTPKPQPTATPDDNTKPDKPDKPGKPPKPTDPPEPTGAPDATDPPGGGGGGEGGGAGDGDQP